MKKAQKRVGVLLDTTRSLGSTLELDRLIKMIMEAAKELLVADRCTLFLFDSQEKQLCAHIQGKDTDTVQEIRIPMGSGIAGYVFTSGESVNIPDAYKDSRFNPEVDRQTGYVTKNILCMPIKNISGECIGVTQMINRRGGPFGLDDEKILSSFSAQAAVAIEKSYLFKKTEDMRSYLQGILSSITNCVITLNDAMHMRTMNRNWFMNALGLNEATMMENPVTAWMTEENSALLKDILEVNSTRLQVYVSEYELKGPKSTTYINYQIMPIIGEKRGVVLILEDISSEKRAIMTLGRYMSPALAKQVMEEDGSQLGGTRKKVAIVFSDIRSFTKMSESMEPHEVVELLNHHFSDQVNAILAEQGILDKYIGDATMAVFGVPFVSPDDSIHACNAALRMQDSLKILNQTREMQGLRSISIGLGVNTGVVLSGNIGSTKRMEFSCIGDAVNLASRTEGLTKLYHVTILITEFTKAETNDNFITREVDWVIVTGKSQRVVIHELLGKKGDLLSDDLMDGLLLYKQGLELYRSRQFAKAITKFQKAIDIADDGPSKTLMDRCRRFIENPPEEDWDGVYICESK
ncbi:nucleotide cyclase [Polychytrium aggregatum]|uniref:nucleotide cyclase n=1 Tax=Polychytrium aggregatum TaxID=110093 RepID=UPI0022FEDC1E|nr:nucleotide cyclase [Polychytrium aggregatum]KAI9208306.1 nucleotide cyclase [Polychytrium aggregatum]